MDVMSHWGAIFVGNIGAATAAAAGKSVTVITFAGRSIAIIIVTKL